MFFKRDKRDWRVIEREKQIRANQIYERILVKEKRKAISRKKQKEILDVKRQHRFFSERRKKLTTSKILMYFILLNCTIVEAYSMWIMYRLSDLSALYSLIGAVVSESLAYAIYSAKAFNETKEEVRSNFEREKFLYENGIKESQNKDDNDVENETDMEIEG